MIFSQIVLWLTFPRLIHAGLHAWSKECLETQEQRQCVMQFTATRNSMGDSPPTRIDWWKLHRYTEQRLKFLGSVAVPRGGGPIRQQLPERVHMHGFLATAMKNGIVRGALVFTTAPSTPGLYECELSPSGETIRFQHTLSIWVEPELWIEPSTSLTSASTISDITAMPTTSSNKGAAYLLLAATFFKHLFNTRSDKNGPFINASIARTESLVQQSYFAFTTRELILILIFFTFCMFIFAVCIYCLRIRCKERHTVISHISAQDMPLLMNQFQK